MKILILGGTGMLGHRLWIELSKNYNVAAVIRSENPLPELKSFKLSDVLNFTALENIVQSFQPDIIVNAIGLIKQVENHNDTLMNIELNSVLPHRLALLSRKYHFRLILFSTDCVFSGKKGMYKETDFADADDAYGRTKKLGEIEGSNNILTLRTSIIGRELRGKASLVEWFLAQENKEVKGFTKAIFSGFPTKTVATILDKYILNNASLSGVYHLSSDPISKFDLITLIKEEIGLKVNIIPFDDFALDRSLDSSRFRDATQFSPQGWKELVKDVFVNDFNY